jgi:hypothetical protein
MESIVGGELGENWPRSSALLNLLTHLPILIKYVGLLLPPTFLPSY